MSNMNDAPAAAPLHDLKTVGWRIVLGGVPQAYIFPDRPVSFDDPRLQRLVVLSEAEQVMALRDAEIAAWRESAAQAWRNADFYRHLIVRCGEAIGKEAFICDEWGTSVLALKVPELVEAAFKPRNRFLRALSIILKGK